MTYTTAQVNGWYQSVQFRDGPTATVNSYVSLLNSGGLSAAQVQSAVINDTYTFANANSVIRIYQGAFNRVPDAAGQNYWTDLMGATPDAQKPAQLQTIATQFANSTEFLGVYGVNGSAPINGAVLTAFYQNILQRAPDTAGYAYWLNSGQTVAQVLNAFSQSAEFVVSSQTPTTNFQQAQINGTAATSGSLWQYGGGSGTTVNYDLTTNIDTINNTKDSINVNGTVIDTGGGNTTFTPGDSITGNQANNNVLNLSVSGSRGGANATVTSSSQTLNNVQTVKITNFATNSAAGTGASIFDASLWTGVKTVDLFASTTDGAANGNGNTQVNNLKNIVDASMQNGAASLTIGYQSGATTGSSTAQKLTLNGQTGGTFSTAGVETLNIVAGSTESKSVTVDVSDSNLTAVNISGSGAAGITFADTTIKSFDASTATGKLTLDISASVNAQDVTYKGGTGNDIVTIGSSWNKDDSIDGGAGTNTLNITGSTGANVSSGIKNFSNLRVTKVGDGVNPLTINADVQNFTASTINVLEAAVTNTAAVDGTLNFTGVNNNSTLAIVTGTRTNANANGSVITATLKADTSADTLTIESRGQEAKTVQANQIETVNMVSTTNSTGAVTANTINTVNVTAATAVNVSGAADLTISSFNQKASTDAGTVSTFDASKLTGKATITFGSAGNQTIKGGTGNDAITMVAGSLNTDDTIDLGGGTNTLTATNVAGDLGVLNISNTQTVDLTQNADASFDLRSDTSLSTLKIAGLGGNYKSTVTSLVDASTVSLTGGDTAAVSLGWASSAKSGTMTFLEGGGATYASIAANGLPTLNIVGDASGDAVAITNLTGTGSLTKIVVSGVGAISLNGSTTTSAVATIDASGATGAFTLSSTFGRASTATITGGNGDDSIGLNINTQGGNTIDAGAGTNTLKLAGNGNIATSVIDLTSLTDQIVSLNGTSNTAIQKGFTNFDGTGLAATAGYFGVNVSAANGSTVVGSGLNDVLTGPSSGAATLIGNAGNDSVTLTSGTTNTYNFANTLVGTQATTTGVAASVGVDAITGFNSTTSVFNFSTTVFGGVAGAYNTNQISVVATTATTIATDSSQNFGTGNYSKGAQSLLLVGTNGAGNTADIYWYDGGNTVATDDTVAELVVAGNATKIGSIGIVNTALVGGDFIIV